MNELITYTGYHATSSVFVNSIKKYGFKFKYNEEHWLGNGVYFFLDPYLAEWWGRNPTKKFGSDLPNDKILQVKITALEDDVCDLRILKDYLFCNETYKMFCSELEDAGEPILHSEITKTHLRCMYFDWLVENFKVKVCIASFFKVNPEYLEIGQMQQQSLNKSIGIPFYEVQLCVFDKGVIYNIITYDKKEDESYASV